MAAQSQSRLHACSRTLKAKGALPSAEKVSCKPAASRKRRKTKAKSGPVQQDNLAPLVVLAQSGDIQARNELFAQLRPAVRLWARVEVGEGRADDLCQEVMMRAHRKLKSLDAPEAIRKWLRVMTRRLGYNLLKRERPERRWWASATNDRALDIFDLIPGRENDPAQEILDDEDRKACLDEIWRVVERLNFKQRILAKLYYGEGRSVSAIARALGEPGCPIPLGTVKTLLNRLRINIRAAVGNDGIAEAQAPDSLEA